MSLADTRLKQLDDPSLTAGERILLRCRLAAEFIHAGQYEIAREALGELWRGIGERPETKGLRPAAVPEVLLQCGVLSSWLGHIQHVPGAQEAAKDLLSEAQRMFESQRRAEKVAEAKYELGMCYFWLGSYEESRIVLDGALKGLEGNEPELRAKILIRRSIVEVWTGRYHDALRILEEAETFFEGRSDALKGRWYGQKALVLRRLAVTERRSDYADRAIMESTAAIYHYEQAQHERYCVITINNLVMMFYQLGRYAEAYEHLDRAVGILERLDDDSLLAQVNETRARVLVAEQRYKEADRVITSVIQSFQKGEEFALLADALTIQGVVWARLGMHEGSLHVLRQAVSIAQDSGSSSNAGLAALTLIEEHGRERLSETELYEAYQKADELLKDTQDAQVVARLRGCARIVTRRLLGPRLSDEGFVLPDVVLEYEARFIRQALEAERGVVSRAAHRLGIRHQTLIHILKTRHQGLLNLRATPRSRRKSIIRVPNKPARRPKAKKPQTVTILHAEDDEAVASVVRDTLEARGWRVKSCADGITALRRLASWVRYDLLLFDNDLPGVNGLELTRTTRKLAHRRRTPIIMFSASDVETEAWKAGVDAFLRKPEDIGNVTAMATRLLSKGK
jgi:CheY-like chemotaxis protein